jgi:hypothetical protein
MTSWPLARSRRAMSPENISSSNSGSTWECAANAVFLDDCGSSMASPQPAVGLWAAPGTCQVKSDLTEPDDSIADSPASTSLASWLLADHRHRGGIHGEQPVCTPWLPSADAVPHLTSEGMEQAAPVAAHRVDLDQRRHPRPAYPASPEPPQWPVDQLDRSLGLGPHHSFSGKCRTNFRGTSAASAGARVIRRLTPGRG